MRLVIIPPYQTPIANWGWVLREMMDDFRKLGQLEGVEVDVDEGYFLDSTAEHRDEEIKAFVTIGILKKVKEYSESGKYDGIVLTAGLADPGFIPARVVSKVPVAAAVHSSFHLASLIGDRFSTIHSFGPTGVMVRHYAESFGFSDKLASVRVCGHTTFEMFRLLSKHKNDKPQRIKDPGIKKVVDDIVAQCVAAIEKDRADTVILGNEPLNALRDEVRQGLTEAGYDEIPLISNIAAAIQMARTMASLKLVKAARAYPTVNLRARQEYW